MANPAAPVLYTNKEVTGAAIVTASVALVKATLGINSPLFVAEISNFAEAFGVVPIPTSPSDSILILSVRVALASGVVENVMAVGISAAELAAASRSICICAWGVVT